MKVSPYRNVDDTQALNAGLLPITQRVSEANFISIFQNNSGGCSSRLLLACLPFKDSLQIFRDKVSDPDLERAILFSSF